MSIDKDQNLSATATRRRQAEERLLTTKGTTAPPRTNDEGQRLVHELEVHQIELELQNAELLQARDETALLLEQYTDLYDFAPVGYFTLDLGGTIRSSNLTGAGLLGVERCRLNGRYFRQFLTEEDRPAFATFLNQIFLNPAKATCEAALLAKEHSPRSVQIEAVAAASGEYCHLAVIDITRRILAEEELRESGERHRLLVETMLHGVVHQDATGWIVAMNPAAERILGKSQEEFLGSSSEQEEHHTIRENGESFPGREHPSMVALRFGHPVRGVIMGVFNPHLDAYRWISVDAVPVFRRNRNQPTEVYSVFEDVTEKKQTEETLRRTLDELLDQQERLRELALELALAEDRERDRIATELHDEVTQRLILAKMKADQLSYMLATTALGAPAEVISTLLDQSIQDTRLVTSQIRPPFLASSGLEATIQWLGEELHEHYGLRLDLICDREPQQLEYGIRAAVFQAVRELLQNVVKHAGTDLVRVRLAREGAWRVISVEDDGSGFDAATIPVRKARSGGFGLLNIRQKIEYLGGSFRLDSQPGTGTRATIRMPLDAPVAEPEAPEKLKILLVDDQSFVREGLRALVALEPDMVVVAEAGNGRSAVTLAQEHRPDVVVMDLSMPGLNGIDATRAITEELAGVKVLAFSVEADRRFVVDVLKAGARGYVLKDSAFAILATAIRMVAAGETYLGPRIAEIIIREYLQRVPEHAISDILTEREREILQMIAAGQNTKEIAFALEVSIKTIDSQRHSIMNKLNLNSIAELTKYAIRTGMTTLT